MRGESRHWHVLVIALMLTMPLSAQEYISKEEIKNSVTTHIYDEYKNVVAKEAEAYITKAERRNSLRVSYGIPGPFLLLALDLLMDEESKPAATDTSLSGQLANTRYYNTSKMVLTAMNIEYSRKVTRKTSVGVKCSIGFNNSSRRHVWTNDILYRNNKILTTAVVNARFDWLQRDAITLYSSIGVGISSRFSFYDGLLFPTIDATYIGITIGRRLYGFAEIGGGMSGAMRAGLGYNF